MNFSLELGETYKSHYQNHFSLVVTQPSLPITKSDPNKVTIYINNTCIPHVNQEQDDKIRKLLDIIIIHCRVLRNYREHFIKSLS